MEGVDSVPSAMRSASMNISAAFSEKAQLSQFVPSNFSMVESNSRWLCQPWWVRKLQVGRGEKKNPEPAKTAKSTKTTIEEVPDEDSSSDFITDLEEDSDDGWEEGDNEIIGRFQILRMKGLQSGMEDDLEDDDEEAATEIKTTQRSHRPIPWSSDSSKFYTTGLKRQEKSE
ncbi:hypothetical protein JB92DRAFT_3145576 [Gautieria morchelliformis]|nr:hypothetical protein JB92DRAFT_3145576 [Gautieria morchelliformis]